MFGKKEKLKPEDLTRISILADAPKGALRIAAAKSELVSLKGGEALLQAGDEADCIYFLRSGVLGAFQRSRDGTLEMLGYVRSGEPVGEMAFLANTPHANALYAIRDSELLKLHRDPFDKMVKRYPSLLKALAKMMIVRLRKTRHVTSVDRSQPKVFALLATSPTIDCAWQAEQLSDALKTLGKSVVSIGPEADGQPTAWFDEQERMHDVVLLHAPVADNDWFRMCLRQADRLWIMGREDARPSRPLLPPNASPADEMRLIDVIVLQNVGRAKVSTGSDWKAAANAVRVFKWRTGNAQDASHLARIAAGKSVGLVLSGGGARAYAHIGAVRALREAHIPIDFVGGTSMGAIIAANVALGWDDEQMERIIRNAFVKSNPVDDYVIPVVALTKGEKVRRRLKKYYGDIRVEDLQLPFYCVSTNLTSGQSAIHKSGVLRDVLAASIALPGIIPPMVLDKEVHVDGAVLNNFPVNVMQGLHRGPVLGVDVSRARGLAADEYIDPPSFVQWVTEHGFRSAPPIVNLLMRSATLPTSDLSVRRREADILIVPEMGNIDIRDWKNFDATVEAGYRATKQAIQDGLLNELV